MPQPQPDGPFLTTTRTGAVVTVTIDRPPANAVNPALIEEFLAVLPPLADDPTVRCLVIRGTGRYFVAGADIAVMRDTSEPTQREMRRWVEVQRLLELSPKPVIAALNGYALGGGAELSLACDLRVASDTARIGFPEMSLGLFPGAGGSQRLPRLVGRHRAVLMMIEGRHLTAAEALDSGLVDRVLPAAGFLDAVEEIAQEWAAKPTATIGLLKRSVDAGAAVGIDEAMAVEWDAVLQVMRTADAAEGLQSFLDRRPPVFGGS